MMDCMREIFGDDRIKGEKFPQEKREEIKKQQEGESDSHYAIRSYLMNKSEKESSDMSYEDMNPNGFWECMYSVQGIRYNHRDREDLKKMRRGDIDKSTIVKVVSQGLLSSDPSYIDKVVYMVRHPRAVAKSHEKLKRGFDTKFPDGKVRNIFDGLVIHSPEMYIQVTISASRWILDNPDIDIHFVNFDELIANPKDVIDGVVDFLTIGDASKAYSVIEPKLNRSKPENIEHVMWEDAEYVYEKFVNKEYQDILDYFKDPKRNFNREKQSWYCPRYGQSVTEKQCKLCRSDKVVRENFKTFAMQQFVDWENEPCFYESGMDVDREKYLTISQSIKQNFWNNELWLEINDAGVD
jgi:hypothetical protein